MKSFLRICLFLFLVVFATKVTAQTKQIEKIIRKGNEIVIEYEKYKLSNGLTLLIHEDHSDPMVYVSVMYHVGSAREQEGRSGFAHFFEHMMFAGSEHVADGLHAKIITEAGGKDNGNTTRDRTDYWELLPSNQLETALWLESDRMGFFIDAISQQKFEIQRETVKNERGQNYDNRPLGVVNERIAEILYPSSHPYAWQTIGYIGDLNKVTVNDLKSFYMRWYGPNNATLTIAGDVNPTEVVRLTEKYFATIPSGPAVQSQKVAPVVLDKNRYVSYRNKISLPLITFTFPTVPAFHPDEAPLDILANILGEGRASVFYQYFIKAGDVESLDVQHPCFELAGEFKIILLAKKLKHFEKMLNEAFEEFEKKGITNEDLKKFTTQYEVKKMDDIQSLQDKGSLLAFYQTYTGTPNYITKDFERYNNVTKEDIMRVFKKYIKDKPSAVLTVYTQGCDEFMKQDNYTPPTRNTNTLESDEYKNLSYVKPKDNFDRNIQPVPAPAPIVKVPDFWTSTMNNGLKIIGTKSDELPFVTLKISIQAGHRFENKEEEGISQLLTSMLKQSTTKNTGLEIELKLEQMGSKINISSNDEEIVFYVSTLTRNLDSTLVILEDIIMHPKFSRSDFDKVWSQKMNQITSGAFYPNELMKKLMAGKEHILGSSAQGTRESVKHISAKEVKEYYQNKCVPSLASVVFVGNIDKEQAMKKLSFLNNWKDNKYTLPSVNDAPRVNKTVIYFLNRPYSTQSQIRVGLLGLPYDATGDFYKSSIATYALAVPFSSRINLNLREAHGYGYYASSGYYGNKYEGPYIIEAEVRSNATDSALTEIMNEIKNYADKGITKEELLFTQNSMLQNEAMKYETPDQKIAFLKKILDFNLSNDFTTKQHEILKNISLEEVNAIAKKSLPYKNMVIFIMGNRETVYGKLKYLPFELYEINSMGKILGTN